jgi:NADPH:quinone reductase-like Zn-dependent oxidoreductase
MQHHVIHRPGGYERLQLEAGPPPPDALDPDAVEIDVRACGVNFADCVVRMGLYESAKHYVGWPITPGFEVAGVVRRVGAAVTAHRPGDAVIGVTRFGGYATRLTVPAVQVFARPPAWSDAQAAAFPAVHLTAWWALFELAHPRPGAHLLVHSAAGGGGQALCALGRIAGAQVTGVVGAASKVDAARHAGAHQVEVAGPDLEARLRVHAAHGFDGVLDATGYQTLPMSWRLLGPGGKLVVYGFHTMLPRQGGRPSWAQLAWSWLRTPRFSPLAMTGENRAVMGFNLSYLFARHDVLRRAMNDLLAHVAAGRMTSPPVTELPFDEVAEAHRRLESGATVGKLVLVV